MLEGLFQQTIEGARGINRPYNQYLFFSYWCEKVGAELKRRYTLDPTILVSFQRWVDLSEGLNWFWEHPESEIVRLPSFSLTLQTTNSFLKQLYDASGNGLYWTYWPADKVTQFVDKILVSRFCRTRSNYAFESINAFRDRLQERNYLVTRLLILSVLLVVSEFVNFDYDPI